MYTKIVAHNKKEETLKVATEMKKQEELKRKKKKEARSKKQIEQEEQVKQAQGAEQPAEGPPQEINENAQLDQYLQKQDLAGQRLL